MLYRDAEPSTMKKKTREKKREKFRMSGVSRMLRVSMLPLVRGKTGGERKKKEEKHLTSIRVRVCNASRDMRTRKRVKSKDSVGSLESGRRYQSEG